MKVITEDIIRRQFRKKQLWEGAELIVDSASLITPSAHSYLREHHIQVVDKIKENSNMSAQLITDDNGSVQQLLSNYKEPQNKKQVELEIKHLINLFYFPLIQDSCFSNNWWLFFEKQQEWLKAFNQLDTKNIPALDMKIESKLYINIENYRVWLFSFNEINIQIEKIQYLLTEKWLSQCFNDWSNNLIKVIQSPKKK